MVNSCPRGPVQPQHYNGPVTFAPRDRPAYFDHNATSPPDPRVVEAMVPWLGRAANASAVHAWGQAARDAVERARAEVAELLATEPAQVVLTGSATEANNTVLASCGRLAGHEGRIVVSAVEHPSVLRPAERLAADGMELVTAPCDGAGRVAAEALLAAAGTGTRLVALMLANNEVGTLQPVGRVAEVCRERGVPVLCDAVQAVGRLPVSPAALGVDYLTVSAHKLGGPQGVGALWIRRGAPLEPLLLGGRQERRRRAGTEPVAAVVGFGVAAALARTEGVARRSRCEALRSRLEAGVERLGGRVHAATAPRLPNTTHLAFPGVVAADLLIRLDLAGFAVSNGSACAAGATAPSHVLAAMGLEPREAAGSIRVSLGPGNDETEVDALLAALGRESAALGVRPAVEEVR